MSKVQMIFDPVYGFISLTEVEWEIIHSPFYQRLRWIKQLGFSSYVFHGAEHSRFGHSLGVLYNAHRILQSTGRGMPDPEFFSKRQNGDQQHIRLAALLHDVGTFPFSHTLEGAYMRFEKGIDHERLGAMIIKNTNYDQGITQILEKYSLSPERVSKLVRGVDDEIYANQILHSEVDCDRMDYLLRDAYYTGLQYGTYDRDYLLHHFNLEKVAGKEILTIRSNALHCVEDFLTARFAWYSQVIRSSRGAKFDAIAEEVCLSMLQNNQFPHYSEIEEMVLKHPMKLYQFNDGLFLKTVGELLEQKKFKNPKTRDLAECLLLEKSPFTIKCREFNQRLLNQDDTSENEKVKRKAEQKLEEIEEILKKKGSSEHWIVSDIPKKNIVFVKSHKRVVKGSAKQNILLERDPVKMSFDDGSIKLLGEVENSIISKLQNSFYFTPNVFCSQKAYELLVNENII